MVQTVLSPRGDQAIRKNNNSRPLYPELNKYHRVVRFLKDLAEFNLPSDSEPYQWCFKLAKSIVQDWATYVNPQPTYLHFFGFFLVFCFVF
jgi:hypothetical protein